MTVIRRLLEAESNSANRENFPRDEGPQRRKKKQRHIMAHIHFIHTLAAWSARNKSLLTGDGVIEE